MADKMQKKNENKQMGSLIRRYLLVVMIAAFLVSFLGVSAIQIIYEKVYYYSLLSGHVNDILTDSHESIGSLFSDWSEALKDRVEGNRAGVDNDYLEELVKSNKRYLSELDVVDENGIITYSSDSDLVGFDMHSDINAAKFLCLLSGEEYYKQEVLMPAFGDPEDSMAYSGRPFSDGSGFVMLGIDKENYENIIDENSADEVRRRHIGVNGKAFICKDDYTITASAYDEYNGRILDNTDILPDAESDFKRTRGKLFGQTCYIVAVRNEDGYVIGMVPTKEADFFGFINRLMIIVMNIFIFICMFLVLSKLLNDHVVKGVEQIDESLEKITDGNLEEKLNVNNSLEFEKLSTGINTMVDRLKSMIAQEKARIDSELEQAMTIQTSSLPSVFPPYPNRKEFEIFATMKAAKVVGGDFYDFYMIDDDHLVLVVADVSGKGIPAALFMMSAKTIIRSMSEKDRDPSKILIDSNAALSEDNKEDMFVTVWLGILTISTGKLTYANAGHNKAALYQDGRWEFSGSGFNGVALGLYKPDEMEQLPEKYRITDRSVILKAGDAVFQYTDGLTEAHNKDNEIYGTERLLKALNGKEAVHPEDVLKAAQSGVDEFVKDAPQFDDITMLGVIYRGSNS